MPTTLIEAIAAAIDSQWYAFVASARLAAGCRNVVMRCREQPDASDDRLRGRSGCRDQPVERHRTAGRAAADRRRSRCSRLCSTVLVIVGMSACLASAIGSQTSSSSSLVGPPSASATATSLRQAAKKRVSKRRTRPGGVMARATKRSVVQRRLHAVFGKALPVAPWWWRTRPCGRSAGRLPHRSRGSPTARWRGPAPRVSAAVADGELGEFLADAGLSATAMRLSAGSVRPPGNTNLPGMKAWRAWRRPISTLKLAAGAVEQDQRCRVARPQRACRRARDLPASALSICSSGHAFADAVTASRLRFSLGMRVDLVLAAEAVHVERPLQADDRALDRPQQASAKTMVSGTQMARCCQVDSVRRRLDAHEAADARCGRR